MSRTTGGAASGRRRLSRVAVLGAALGLALTAATGVASASSVASASTQSTTNAKASVARSGVLPFQGADAGIQPAAAADLVYHGGFIQDHAAVYLVFWGKQWTSDANGVQTYVTNYFKGLGTSGDARSRVTSQYTGKGGAPTFTGSVLKGTWVDTGAAAPSRASASQIAAEARKGLAHLGVAGRPHARRILLRPPRAPPRGRP